MKKLSVTTMIALAAAVIPACQKGLVGEQVRINEEMSFTVLAPDLGTRATANTFEAEDRVGVYVTDYADASTPTPLQISGNRANNLALTFDGQNWIPEKKVYWGDSKADIYAYYPFTGVVSDVNSQPWAVATDQSVESAGDAMSAYEASDVLWSKAGGTSRTDGAVSLQMKHIMSKLTVCIIAGEDYVGSLPEDADVLIHSTVTDAMVDLEKGSVVKNAYSGAKSIKMRRLGTQTVDGVKAVVFEAIVVPQMLETSVPLLEINSKSVSYMLEDSFNFRPGVAYTYTATLNTSTNAIKVEIGCEIDDWNSTGSGSGGGDGSGDDGGSSGDDDGKTYTDLSASGTANCYLIQKAGDYKFKAVQGNIDGTVGNVKSVEVLWESFGTTTMPNVGDLIASVSYRDGYIRFSTPDTFAEGNALIAAKSSKGIILWSWHIWCASEGWKEQVYYNDAGTMMDRNLGATSAAAGKVGSLGLFYQWGRKDPFLGAAAVSSNERAVSTGDWATSSTYITPSLAEQNPMTFYTGYSNYLPNGSWDSKKTAYDPCPAGWRVPDGGENGTWSKAKGGSSDFNSASSSYGLNFGGTFSSNETVWYPASGYLNCVSGALDAVGSYGYCWSATPNPSYYYNAYYLYFNGDGYVSPSNENSRSYGLSVRCLKE
jgi:uncharacterized protein (TIGR02145 family)